MCSDVIVDVRGCIQVLPPFLQDACNGPYTASTPEVWPKNHIESHNIHVHVYTRRVL